MARPTTPIVQRMTRARLPTEQGEFQLALYRAEDDPSKDHLALVLGDVSGREDVLVRIHSECFTGDVLGSTRCDCGEQLARSMQRIAEEGVGVLLYLRQEGRGIGLLEKLRAYNLQDSGYDTVEANLELGHQADERDYGVAVSMLEDLEVRSVRLLTNNPHKLEGLEAHGFTRVSRVSLEIPAKAENAAYLETKVRRMRHLLDLDSMFDPTTAPEALPANRDLGSLKGFRGSDLDRPTITLSYAQSLDGSITLRRGKSMTLSCPEAMEMTHQLRSRHDGILVGIETVLSDDPRLTVRLVEGSSPQVIVLDSSLRTPLEAQLVVDCASPPWIVATEDADPERQRILERAGAIVLRLPSDPDGQVDLEALLPMLSARGLRSLMVEGGARVITSFLKADVVDRLIVTVAPMLVGGLGAVGDLGEVAQRGTFPRLLAPRLRWVGSNIVLISEVARQENRLEIDEDLLGLSGGVL